jgi:hypothetical protein
MDRLYLDTQQWNYLVESGDMSEGELEGLRDRLVSEVRRGHLAVVSSLPLLQEVMGTERKVPQKYQEMRRVLFEATSHRWLLPLNERHRAEAARGGVIPPPGHYLSNDTRRDIRKLAKRGEEIRVIADETYKQTQRFKQTQESIRTKTVAEVPDRTGRSDLRVLVDEWWAVVDIDAWVVEVVEEGVRDGLIDARAINGLLRDLYPSAWLLTRFGWRASS